jgi:hypothetical protein
VFHGSISCTGLRRGRVWAALPRGRFRPAPPVLSFAPIVCPLPPVTFLAILPTDPWGGEGRACTPDESRAEDSVHPQPCVISVVGKGAG